MVLGRFVEHCYNVGCVMSMVLERHKNFIPVIPVAIQILTALDPMPSVGRDRFLHLEQALGLDG